MDTDTYNSLNSSPPPHPARRMPLPSIHLHPSLSSTSAAARHPQTSTPAPLAGHPSPSLRTSLAEEGGREFETIINRPSHSSSHSAYRTTSRASTASSVGSIDENSEDDDDNQWDHPHRHSHSYTRHHPYQQSHQSQSHHSYSTTTQRQRGPPLSISPSYSSYSRRTSIYSAHSQYSQSHDDMTAFLGASTSHSGASARGSASHSANASADEGSNSNSYYEGECDSPVTTSHGGGIPDGSPAATPASASASAGRPGIGAGAGNQSGGGGQSTIHTATSNNAIYTTQTTSNTHTASNTTTTHATGAGSTTAPLSLDSLPSYPADQKPPFSYPVLIRLAILGSPQKRLLLSQIYSAIEEKFPWYRDSAPKAWKASVRHCLSLNKEFVRIQRAVEDPGVGCGGWWSVGEGMKGLKRPRKRRPAQSRRPEHELDPAAPMIKTPTSAPSPLTIRRRHSTPFEDALTAADPYPRYVSSLSSSSLPPSAGGGEVLLPPIGDYSLRLAPLQLPNIDTNTNTAHLLPTPPSSSRTVVFGAAGRETVIGGEEIKREYEYPPQGHSSFHSSFERPRGIHTPTASSSSSYSTQSYGSASSASSSGRPNPMSISSLLNERGSSISNTVASTVTERLDKMDIDMDIDMETEEPTHRPDHGASSPAGLRASPPIPAPAFTSVQRTKETDYDVEMRPANSANNGAKVKAKVAQVETTPFSSDQTLRPPSPASTSPQSHGRRSATPVSAAAATPKPLPRVPALTEPPPVEQRHREHRDRHREKERERERAPQPHGGGRHGEARPSSRSRVHVEPTAPARPVRPPPPVHVHGLSGTKGSTTTTTRERERDRKSTKSGRSVKSTAKSAGAGAGVGASKPWTSSMDLSVMEPESESE